MKTIGVFWVGGAILSSVLGSGSGSGSDLGSDLGLGSASRVVSILVSFTGGDGVVSAGSGLLFDEKKVETALMSLSI